jgi:hypothetical protein
MKKHWNTQKTKKLIKSFDGMKFPLNQQFPIYWILMNLRITWNEMIEWLETYFAKEKTLLFMVTTTVSS